MVDTVPADGKVIVAFDDITQCIACSRGEGCGRANAAAMFASSRNNENLHLDCVSDIPVRSDQHVLVAIDDHGSMWLWPVFGAYGLPLAGMILATALISAFSVSAYADLIAVAGAIAGLAAGIWLWRKISSRALVCVQDSLGLQSARIVGVVPSTNRESG